MSIDTTTLPPFSHNGKVPVATHTVYLALGSNMGDRRGNLAAALQRLRDIMEISTVSSIYETEPVGYIDQSRFLNIVCRGTTTLSAQELLKYAKDIEVAIGRQPTFRNGPRPIDIDIIFYDELCITQENLIVPHPRMAERAFVLVPLAEIAPDAVDPGSGQTVQELLNAVSQEGVHKLASSLRIMLDRDIQNGQPTVHVRLGRAGVVGITKAILIGDQEGQQQWFNASFDLYADLDPGRCAHVSF
jgi:GTP cyclohydrolase IV